MEIAACINQCYGAITHQRLEDAQSHLSRCQTSPKARGIVWIVHRSACIADEFLGCLVGR
jgi:hypothetical protein